MALGSKGPLPTSRPSHVIRRASNAVSRGHTDHTNEQKLPYLIFLLVHTFGNRALLRTITQGWACRTTRKWEDETKQKGSKQKTGILAMCIAGPVFFSSLLTMKHESFLTTDSQPRLRLLFSIEGRDGSD